MELSRKEILVALGVGSIAVLTGCGGGTVTENSAVYPFIAIQWQSAPTRLAASSLAQSVRISLTAPTGEVATLLAVRPDPVPTKTVQHRFSQSFKPGQLTFEAHFYITSDGSGDIMATASGMLDLLAQGEVSLGVLSISDDIDALQLAAFPSRLSVGESFTPRIHTFVAGTATASANLTAFPASSVRWTYDESMLQRNGDSFTVLRAGRISIQSEFTRRNGEPIIKWASASAQSAPVPGQKHFENFSPLLNQFAYQDLLVGMTGSHATAVLLNPVSGERREFTLPADGIDAFLDTGNELLWSLANDFKSVWKTHLPTGTSEFAFQLPYPRQWQLFPLGGTEEYLLARPVYEFEYTFLAQGRVVGPTFKNIRHAPLVGDGTFVFDVNDQIEHYRPGADGPVLLSRTPRQFDWLDSFKLSPTRLFVGDKTIREPGTQRILHTLNIPSGCANIPQSLSPSGRLALYQGYTEGSADAPRALQTVVYDALSGQQLLDQHYFDAEQCYFVDDHTLVYTEKGGITIQPGLF